MTSLTLVAHEGYQAPRRHRCLPPCCRCRCHPFARWWWGVLSMLLPAGGQVLDLRVIAWEQRLPPWRPMILLYEHGGYITYGATACRAPAAVPLYWLLQLQTRRAGRPTIAVAPASSTAMAPSSKKSCPLGVFLYRQGATFSFVSLTFRQWFISPPRL